MTTRLTEELTITPEELGGTGFQLVDGCTHFGRPILYQETHGVFAVVWTPTTVKLVTNDGLHDAYLRCWNRAQAEKDFVELGTSVHTGERRSVQL